MSSNVVKQRRKEGEKDNSPQIQRRRKKRETRERFICFEQRGRWYDPFIYTNLQPEYLCLTKQLKKTKKKMKLCIQTEPVKKLINYFKTAFLFFSLQVSIKTCWFINYLTRKMFPKCRVNHTTSWIIGLDVEHEDIEVPIRTIF